MNSLAELKRKLTPRSRWGAIGIAPPREFGALTWAGAEERRQPQDGALTNADYLMDEPQVSPLPPAHVPPVPVSLATAKLRTAV